VRSPWLTVPNLLTLLRIGLVPVFAALHLAGRPGWALVCFLAAALSDWLDGLAARILDQQTRLGAFLDPLADKLLTGVALLLLVLERVAPLWLLLLVLVRDLAEALGVAVVRRKGLELPAAPSRVGKYATFALTCLVVLGLLEETFTDLPAIHAWFQVAGYFTALCVVVSTVQYFVRWGYLWGAPRREGGR
jgi:cardiolipin synthase